MAPSNPVALRGGYNFVTFDYFAPQTNLADLVGYDRNDGSKTAWWKIDNTNKSWKLDKIEEYTSSNGTVINGMQYRLNGAARTILVTTTDGADNGVLQIGHPSDSRGGLIIMGGNEYVSAPGQVDIRCGNVGSGAILLQTLGAQPVQVITNGSERLRVDSSGYLNFYSGYPSASSSKNPETDSEAGWFPVKNQAGTTVYIPYYAA